MAVSEPHTVTTSEAFDARSNPRRPLKPGFVSRKPAEAGWCHLVADLRSKVLI